MDALVIGAGPAGLMAAEALARAGRRVLICEAKPSPARKFLMAGKSGLNPVSYTHLDVYKRQEEALAWGLIDRIVAPQTLLETARALCGDALAARPGHAAAIKRLLVSEGLAFAP